MSIVNLTKKAVSQVKIDQEGLDVLRVNLRKDPSKSRVILRLSSEVGIDLPGDQIENLLALGVNTLFASTK